MVDNRSPTPLVKASIPFSTLSFLHSSFKFYFYVCSLTPSFCSAPAGHSTAGSFAGRQRDHSPGVRGTSSLNIGFFSIVIHDAYSSFFFFYARRPFHQGASLGGIVADPLRAGGRITAWGDDVGIARESSSEFGVVRWRRPAGDARWRQPAGGRPLGQRRRGEGLGCFFRFK